MAIVVNPNAQIQLLKIGHEEQPLLIIDDLVANPHELVENAANAIWAIPTDSYYPGLNAQLPNDYLETIFSALRPSLERAFNYDANRRIGVNGFFALTTFDFEDFGPWQRIPHFDKNFSDHLAIVHYLNENQSGGTGFFRHVETGYESISLKRREEYISIISEYIETHGDELNDYAGENTQGFELFMQVPFKFNRAIIYPSNILHCALYDGTNQSADPRNGRLTANSFWVPID